MLCFAYFFDRPHITCEDGFGFKDLGEGALTYFLDELVIFLDRLMSVNLYHIMIRKYFILGKSNFLDRFNGFNSHINNCKINKFR